MNKTTIILSLALLCCGTAVRAADQLKPRLVVMTDIGDPNVEPDDMESAIRLLCYADQIEVEAIMTSVGWNCDPYPEDWAKYLYQVVDAYSLDIKNLMKRSGQKRFLSMEKENDKQKIGYWPSAEYIRSRCMSGSHRAGIGIIGKDNNSEGSDFLIKLADEDDDRPIYVAAWGGANTLAQAIWKVQNTRSEAELKRFLHKFRVYTITDQDMQYNMRMDRAFSSHQWMRREFRNDLLFIWDEGTWTTQNSVGVENWKKTQQMIQGHGNLGKAYPNYKWGVEGDTPSFLYIMPNGLADPEDPTQAGWGGCHEIGLCPDSLTYAWTSCHQPLQTQTENYKKRFYPDELNDFAARIAWAENGMGNHNPTVNINGSKGISQLIIKAKAGEDIVLNASKSKDKDGDKLSFKWWNQPEASTLNMTVDNSTPTLTLQIPDNAQGKSIHIICEVHDNGPFHLVAYKRVIVRVI